MLTLLKHQQYLVAEGAVCMRPGSGLFSNRLVALEELSDAAVARSGAHGRDGIS
jgi:hypothetical protein